MICEVLFPEFCNLYGDSANMRYLEACAPSLTFVYTHNRETPRFASEPVSMLYLGSMPESRQEVAVERLRPYTEQLRRAIEAGTVVLATGNACELFGQYIAESDRRIPMLGLYNFHAERDRGARHNSMFIGRFEANGTPMDIVGNRSQFSTLHGPFPAPFVQVVGGFGNAPGDTSEGYRDRNLFGTYLLGPFLILNPPFTKYLLRTLGLPDTLAYEEEAMAAYRFRAEHLKQEGVPYLMGEHG